jgi:hypothetical protein
MTEELRLEPSIGGFEKLAEVTVWKSDPIS